jgi:hypothetical protein
MANSNDKSEYLAQPPSTCCFVGKIHEGTPRGKMDDIIGVPSYVSHPGEGKGNGHVVLYFPDVWGMSNNSMLLMDGFADAGFITLGMDYFRGVRSPFSSSGDPAALTKSTSGSHFKILQVALGSTSRRIRPECLEG